MDMREGGKIARDGQWLVITESVYIDNERWEHQCGEALKSVILVSPNLDGPETIKTEKVPYCPICETVPSAENW
jgi:hypothetical protein